MRKISAIIPFTDEQLSIGQPLTPEQSAKIDAQWEAECLLVEGADAYNAAVTDSVVHEILTMHKPVRYDSWSRSYHCEGCEASGYESEYPDWPCQTTRKIRAMLEAK